MAFRRMRRRIGLLEAVSPSPANGDHRDVTGRHRASRNNDQSKSPIFRLVLSPTRP
jgi:hypothetical protein